MLLTDGDEHLPLALRDEPWRPPQAALVYPWTMALYSAARFSGSSHSKHRQQTSSNAAARRKLPHTWGAMHAHDRLLYNHQRRRRSSRRRPSRD